MKKRKKKIIIIITIIIVILLVYFCVDKENMNRKYSDFYDSYGCKYIKSEKSKEKDYYRDIYISIPYPAVYDDSISNKHYYEEIIYNSAKLYKDKRIRIIDERQGLIIRINGSNYTINDDVNFFEDETNKLIQKKENDTLLENVTIKSKELNELLKNKWSSKTYFGSMIKKENDYEYYNTGIKIKTENEKVYNIVFTVNYAGEVIDGVKTGLINSQIREILGTPLYNNLDAEIIIGYKTDNFYVFFYNGEISIYKAEVSNGNDIYTNEIKKYLEVNR